MTENEAIKILVGYIIPLNIHNSSHIHKCNQAHEMAIQALKEIQQYRAIGTVKEIKIREAQFEKLSEGYLNDLSLLREYQAIGTIEEFKALKEKNKPKKKKSNKVIFSHDSYAYCPHCHHNVKLLWASHCDKCGGELDWKNRKLQAN